MMDPRYAVHDTSELLSPSLLIYPQLVRRNIEEMISTPRWHEPITWMACEDCGAWVSSELFGPDGAGECDDGGFRCTECRFADEEL